MSGGLPPVLQSPAVIAPLAVTIAHDLSMLRRLIVTSALLGSKSCRRWMVVDSMPWPCVATFVRQAAWLRITDECR